MKIGTRDIGSKFKPFIVAELSGNHNSSLKRALKLVNLAAQAGASAIKLQTFTPDTMTLNIKSKPFTIEKSSLWRNQTLYELYKKAQTPWSWHKRIFHESKKLGMIAFSTPFDESAVDFLEKLKVPCYKIASFELTHIPLVKKIALTRKPIIISTGMATFQEINETVKLIRKFGTKKIIILKCTSSYPSKNKYLNLKTLVDLKKKFKCDVGFSDHSIGIGASVSAISLGACLIEKHFTIKKNDVGIDSAFSSDIDEFKSLVNECNNAWESLGKINYGPTREEHNSKKKRRSIYISKNIKIGECFTKKNIKIIRPGYGLEPKFYFKILGKKAQNNYKMGLPLKKSMIKKF